MSGAAIANDRATATPAVTSHCSASSPLPTARLATINPNSLKVVRLTAVRRLVRARKPNASNRPKNSAPLSGNSSISSAAYSKVSQVGVPLSPIDRKKPTSSTSLRLQSEVLSSWARG